MLNALGGIPSCIDPTVMTAGKTIAATILDLMTKPELLQRAQEEFRTRRNAAADPGPWCDYAPPVDSLARICRDATRPGVVDPGDGGG